MSTFDVRNSGDEIDKIIFDASEDYLMRGDGVEFSNLLRGVFSGTMVDICWIDDLDNFIKACQKAKELWS